MESNRSLQSSPLLSDAELVQQFCEGNEKVLSILISRHEVSIRTLIRSFVKDADTQQDFFQDLLEKIVLLLRKGSYREQGFFGPWVLRVCRNLCLDNYRRQKLLQTHSYDEHPALVNFRKHKELLPVENLIKEEERRFLKQCLEKLPYEKKEMVLLRYFLKMSFKEIVEYKGINKNTALGRMHYAILGLRKLIKKE